MSSLQVYHLGRYTIASGTVFNSLQTSPQHTVQIDAICANRSGKIMCKVSNSQLNNCTMQMNPPGSNNNTYSSFINSSSSSSIPRSKPIGNFPLQESVSMFVVGDSVKPIATNDQYLFTIYNATGSDITLTANITFEFYLIESLF